MGRLEPRRGRWALVPALMVAGIVMVCPSMASAGLLREVRVTVSNASSREITVEGYEADVDGIIIKWRHQRTATVRPNGEETFTSGAHSQRTIAIGLRCRAGLEDGLVFENPLVFRPAASEAVQERSGFWTEKGASNNFAVGNEFHYWNRSVSVLLRNDSDHYKEFTETIHAKACS
jgi:hypothetical protein